jgi:hypothetical protein
VAKDKSQPDQPIQQTQWTLEDMGELQAQIEAQAGTLNRMNSLLESTSERLIAHEKLLAGVSLEERMLPSDVVNGLDPAQIFSIAERRDHRLAAGPAHAAQFAGAGQTHPRRLRDQLRRNRASRNAQPLPRQKEIGLASSPESLTATE